MRLPVLIILAVLWAAVLIPPLLRSRSQRTADSIVDFNYTLDLLGRTNGNLEASPDSAGGDAGRALPRASIPSRGMLPSTARLRTKALPVLAAGAPFATAAQRSAQRRRDVLRVLTGAVLVTLLVAVLSHLAAAWALQAFVDVLFGAYLSLWAWARGMQAERADKVRYMPDLRVPELALRRSASS